MGDHETDTDGRVLLITGASSGIGAATARRARAAGWRVVLAARSLERLQELAEELGGAEHALAVRCDVTEWSDQQQAVQSALDAFGRLDAAFANAGFGGPRGFLEDSVEHWREMVLTNVYGAALTVRAAIPALSDTRGHLLLTSSVAGRRVLPGLALLGAPSTPSRRWARPPRQDLNGTGVRVTLIEPGMVDTPFFDSRPTDALQDDDIARAVLYALSQPAARGRQRDPRPAHRTAGLSGPAAPRGGQRLSARLAPGATTLTTRPRRPVLNWTVPAARA